MAQALLTVYAATAHWANIPPPRMHYLAPIGLFAQRAKK